MTSDVRRQDHTQTDSYLDQFIGEALMEDFVDPGTS